jgi:hypothetical protein
MVFDAHRLEYVNLHVHLIATPSDFRGLQELTEMGGSPHKKGCLVCWLPGGPKCNGRGKQPYTGHRVWLSPGHCLRELLYPLHKHSADEQRVAADTSDVRYRSREQWAERRKEPGGGCASGPLFATPGAGPAPGGGGGSDDEGGGNGGPDGGGGGVAGAAEPNPLARNPCYPPALQTIPVRVLASPVVYDPMHTLGGIMKSSRLATQNMKDLKGNVAAYERDVNSRTFTDPASGLDVHVMSESRTRPCMPYTLNPQP